MSNEVERYNELTGIQMKAFFTIECCEACQRTIRFNGNIVLYCVCHIRMRW